MRVGTRFAAALPVSRTRRLSTQCRVRLDQAIGPVIEALEDRQLLSVATTAASASRSVKPSAVLTTKFLADNSDASKVTLSGAWTTTSAEPGFFGNSYAVSTGAGTASFRPAATPGNYNLYLRWTTGGNHASNVPVEVKTKTGTAQLLLNQQTRGGSWIYLGTYSYGVGSFEVVLRSAGADGAVIADAIMIEQTKRTPTAFPTAPGNLTASAPVSPGPVNLAWKDAATGETGYRVERSADGKQWTAIKTTGANAATFQDGSVSPDTLYYYRLRTVYPDYDSVYGNTVSVRTPKLPPPATPTSLAATAPAYNRINLTWNDVANNETNYLVERSPDGTKWTRIATLGANAKSYADSGVSAKTRYYYHVAGQNAVGLSGWSNVASVTTPAVPVTPPPPPIIPPTPGTKSAPIIGAYVVPVENMDRFKTYGINTLVHSETQGGRYTQAQWRAEARKRGFKYIDIPSGNIAADEADPNLLAYLLPDEPVMHKWPVSVWKDVYDTIRNAGGHKPIFGNFSGPDITVAQNEKPPYDGSKHKPFIQYADWLCNDWYVKNKNVERYPTSLISDAMNLLDKWSGGKPQLAFVEGGDMNLSELGRAPTEAEMKEEVRLIMSHPDAIGYIYFTVREAGDHGRGYMPFTFDTTTPTMRIAITEINKEMLATRTVLL